MTPPIAVVFPGQASQYVGMGKTLYDNSQAARELYQFASDTLGEDIARISFNGPIETLRRTRFTQPAILTHSLAVLAIVGDALPSAQVTAGHSLGEYGALVLAGSLTAHDAIRLVILRAQLMEQASQASRGTMAAVLGMELTTLEEICRSVATTGIVVPANINSTGQIAISGEVKAVEEAGRIAKERGAKRVIMLEVGGAFHSPLMRSAQEGMRTALKDVPIAAPQTTFIPNVSATPEANPDRIRELLVEQITAPVRWLDTMGQLKRRGVKTVIEVGPGAVLVGFAKRDVAPETCVSLDTWDNLQEIALSTTA